MKKLILSSALIAISLQGVLYAQEERESYVSKLMQRSKAEQTFNANEGLIDIRDYVTLKEGRLILELSDVSDYESFKSLDSILIEFRKDISFYRDSLASNPTGNFRIDYCFSPGYSFKKIHFKSYSPDGSMFLNQNGEISKLKFEQDTIRIIIQKSKPGLGARKSGGCMIPYSIQATFLLDNYYDIDKVINDHVLRNIVDTLEKSSQKKKFRGNNVYVNPFSIVYNPYYNGKGGLQIRERLIRDEYDLSGPKKNTALELKASLGVGQIRNEFTSMAELGFQIKKIRYKLAETAFFKVTASPYLFFSGNSTISDNWFVNAEYGTIEKENQYGWVGKAATFGAGYLISSRGGYFTNTTFKLFTELQFVKGFSIVPEVYFTNNCKQVFPGFTLKVF